MPQDDESDSPTLDSKHEPDPNQIPDNESRSEKIEALLQLSAKVLSDAESTQPCEPEKLIHSPNFQSKQQQSNSGGDPSTNSGERFQILELLGSGSMGKVYKAYDPLLQRYVALKFLRSDDPAQLSQFLREARAQARVGHEHICKIYEVGELQGKHYIAMQYISGKTLQFVADEMMLEEKVKVLKQISEAVHAAHQIGLIHRDLKPSNIMVEKTDEEWKPYVMDFGLVREQEAPGITRTGMVVGSPAYMAPEQAMGDLKKLDRRSDVYSLGSTLYELLSNKRAFDGMTASEVILKVLQQEAEPLRRVVPSIPRDLETIVMKCLEKEQHRRYDSARALALDLQRYLDGDPVQARRSTWQYQILKKAKKHKVAAVVVTTAITIIFLFAGLWLQTRWFAGEQARLAQQFGQEVEKIDGFMRYAYTLPLHDVRRERAVVKERMKWIENEMKNIGKPGIGPGNYALGRGYIALHQYEDAKKHLTLAWNHQYRIPEVAYALGQSLGVLYQLGLQEVERIGSKETREARKHQLEKEFREPSLLYLKQSVGAKLEAPAYVEGLIAFYEKRYEDCLKRASQASLQIPWLYEIDLLAGNAYLQIGSSQRLFGEYKKALENFSLADKKFEQASAIARSDATIYESQCKLWGIRERIFIDTGQTPEEAFTKVIATCEKALTANPDSAEAYETQAHAMWLMGWYEWNTGKDPTELFLKSISMSQRAQTLSPRMVAAYNHMTHAYHYLGDYTAQRGMDPREHYQKAIQSCEKALRIDENDYFSHFDIGGIYISMGEYVQSNGTSPQGFFQKAIEGYQRAIKINPNASEAYNNLATIYSMLGDLASNRGEDPTVLYRKAIQGLEKAITLNPNVPYSFASLGAQHYFLALYALQNGKDPTPELNQALEIFQKGMSKNPNFFYLHECIGSTYCLLAEYEVQKSSDPQVFADKAIASLKKALELNPQDMDTPLELSKVYAQRAKFLIRKKRSPLVEIQKGDSYLEQAMKLNSSISDFYLRKGEMDILRAEWAIQSGQSPIRSLRKSKTNLDQAIQINPQDIRSYIATAKCSLLESEWTIKNGKKAEEVIDFGLTMTDKASTINPNHAEAMAIRGKLFLVRALSEKDKELRAAAARTGLELLEKSLQKNPLLKSEYQSSLEEVHALL